MVDRNLRQWMRKEDIYDNDLYDILQEQGIENPQEDFIDYTEKDWKELWRRGCVERAKELKDQKAKVRLEKKLKKLERYWRKQSGIKSTSIRKRTESRDKPPIDNSSHLKNEALSKGENLKKYLQKNECFSSDLLMVCVSMKIYSENDIILIDSNKYFDEICRQVRVLKSKELKDNTSRIRMEKQMIKFEKLWRIKTGIKKTSIKSNKNKGKKQRNKNTKKKDKKSSDLKEWMKKNDVWEMSLYEELKINNISNEKELKRISEHVFDKIVRKVRVDRFSQLKDQKSRNRADKLLVRFEKKWRNVSGVKKTSIR
eukprot:96169_1